MSSYAYRAVDESGRRVRGGLDAPNAKQAGQELERRGLFLLELAEGQDRPRVLLAWPGSGRRQLLELTRSIAALLESGLPVAKAVTITESVVGGRVAEDLARVQARLERGEEFAAALDTEPSLFSPVYVGVVRAGARSGDLTGAFRRLTVHLEREAETRGRVISSLAYPAALAVFGGMSILVILFFVVPRFAELLFDAGAQVPTTTAILVGVSALLREHWISVVSISVVSALLGFRFLRSSRGREISFRVALALPLVGSLQRELLAARFARLSSVLIQGGASLLSALDGSARGMDNRASEAQLARVRARVREGERLNRALAGSGIFPDLLVRLVAVGEESGRIGEFLEKAAQIFEERVQRSVQRVVVLLEPALIVFFGGLVAVVALALLQAIYGVNAGVFR